jgi:hypothetical protein
MTFDHCVWLSDNAILWHCPLSSNTLFHCYKSLSITLYGWPQNIWKQTSWPSLDNQMKIKCTLPDTESKINIWKNNLSVKLYLLWCYDDMLWMVSSIFTYDVSPWKLYSCCTIISWMMTLEIILEIFLHYARQTDWHTVLYRHICFPYEVFAIVYT